LIQQNLLKSRWAQAEVFLTDKLAASCYLLPYLSVFSRVLLSTIERDLICLRTVLLLCHSTLNSWVAAVVGWEIVLVGMYSHQDLMAFLTKL